MKLMLNCLGRWSKNYPIYILTKEGRTTLPNKHKAFLRRAVITAVEENWKQNFQYGNVQ